MKVLSIRQPWAWAILHAHKDIENRDWVPSNPARRFRGRFLIHASAGMTRVEYGNFIDVVHDLFLRRMFPSELTIPAFEKLPRGGIVGMVTIVDMVSSSASPWFFGPLGLVIRDVKPLPFMLFKGMLGFFDGPSVEGIDS